MIYHKPDEVCYPKDFVTNVTVISEGTEETVAIAKVTWEGKEQLGIRWNVARREWDDEDKRNEQVTCSGMPSSHGYPVWFILPEGLVDTNSEAFKNFISKNENLIRWCQSNPPETLP